MDRCAVLCGAKWCMLKGRHIQNNDTFLVLASGYRYHHEATNLRSTFSVRLSGLGHVQPMFL